MKTNATIFCILLLAIILTCGCDPFGHEKLSWDYSKLAEEAEKNQQYDVAEEKYQLAAEELKKEGRGASGSINYGLYNISEL